MLIAFPQASSPRIELVLGDALALTEAARPQPTGSMPPNQLSPIAFLDWITSLGHRRTPEEGWNRNHAVLRVSRHARRARCNCTGNTAKAQRDFDTRVAWFLALGPPAHRQPIVVPVASSE